MIRGEDLTKWEGTDGFTLGPVKGQPLSTCYILPGSTAEVFSRAPVGKLVPVHQTDTAPSTFTRLDCFDQSLRRSGRMLLQHGPNLELVMPQGQTIGQTVAHGHTRAVDLADGPVAHALADMSRLRRLLPFGSATIVRSGLAFEDDAGKTRCRADLLRLTGADGASATIVRLHGMRGYDKALAAVSLHLQTCGGSSFAMTTLHSLLFPGQIVYEAKPTVILTADLSAFDAATQIIARYILVAHQNEAGIVADFDTEFLHDYRVALRKIRSVLSLFKGVYAPAQTADLKARVSAIMAWTGPLRDLDVLLLEKQQSYDLLPSSLHAGLDALFALRAAERAKALTRLARHLNSRSHAQEMVELLHLFSTPGALQPGPKADMPVPALARSLVWKRFKTSRQIAISIGPDTSDLAIHGLRIHSKKLRYLMEFSAGLFHADAVKSATKTVKMLQTHLGRINDLSVQLGTLQSALAGADAWPNGEKLQLAQSLGALTAVLHQRKLDERIKTAAIVATFATTQTHDQFRELYHPRTLKP